MTIIELSTLSVLKHPPEHQSSECQKVENGSWNGIFEFISSLGMSRRVVYSACRWCSQPVLILIVSYHVYITFVLSFSFLFSSFLDEVHDEVKDTRLLLGHISQVSRSRSHTYISHHIIRKEGRPIQLSLYFNEVSLILRLKLDHEIWTAYVFIYLLYIHSLRLTPKWVSDPLDGLISVEKKPNKTNPVSMSTDLLASPIPPTLIPRRSSYLLPYIPGGFDAEHDLSPLEADSCCSVDFMTDDDARGDLPTTGTETGLEHPQDESSLQIQENTETATGEPDHDDSFTSALPPLPDHDGSSLLPLSSDDGDRSGYDNQTLIEEKEMRRKLMEMESSFLPEPSTIDLPAVQQHTGADDTYLVGVPAGDTTDPAQPGHQDHSLTVSEEASYTLATAEDKDQNPQRTRAESENGTTVDDNPNTPSEKQEDNATTLETIESPAAAAAAAARTGERDPPTSSEDAEELNQTSHEESADRSSMVNSEQALQLTPRPTGKSSRSASPTQSKSTRDSTGGSAGGVLGTGSRRGRRPKYLASRQSAHRLSYSSVTSHNSETTNSDANFGADYALQSGGAAPGNGQRKNLARSISLGSMASGVSGYAEESSVEKRNSSGGPDGALQTLDEEDAISQSYPEPFQQGSPTKDPSPPTTPKARPSDSNVPTDTAVAERIKDIQVPSTFAKQFRENHGTRGLSPDKRTGTATPGFARSGRTMTLKEQSSTIDRLSKENFDLKMRIHFLSEALNKRSEEGIKEMISENVELKSDKLKIQKDNQGLKRKIRDLEKQLKDQQSDKDSMVNHDPEGSDDDHRDHAQGEETLWLRERVETYELEIEKLRSESIARESEKRRLAEMVKSLSDGRPVGSDVGAREERVG